MFNDVAVAIRDAFSGRGRPAAPPSSTSTSIRATAPPRSSPATPRVFTLSIHEADNYPYVKPPSSLDIGLPRGTGDDEYLAQLDGALARVLEQLPDVRVLPGRRRPLLRRPARAGWR